ncbi:MAG: roadblock/LC7 domain-containing protein [Sulfuritalea sp.]|nr:roadblock/LC7 domain-containing protein [Sulfuritalea sp.]OHC69975.1 MAG: hypothetical protein A2045_17345 [Rhodocyclales bacterium GWA2_65_20]
MTIFKLAQTTQEAYKSSLRGLLRGMNASVQDIEASAVISGDGLLIASVLGPDTDSDRYAAMCASLLALAERAALEIARGNLRLVLVDGEKGSMLLVRGEANTVLAVAARSKANLGMVFRVARETASRIPPVPSGT